jgi:hypothetical protein
MLPRLAAAVLVLNLASLLFSLWCILFGPWMGVGLVLGTIGFFLSVGALAVGQSKRGKRAFGRSGQGLAQDVPAFRAFQRPMKTLSAIQVFIIVVAVITLFCTSCGFPDGVANFYGVPPIDQYPVFQRRESYVLTTRVHGTEVRTEVSRLRYVAVGIGFFVGWLGMAALPSLLSLHYVLFGRLPEWLEKRLAKNQR